jgi:hypothetical protein
MKETTGFIYYYIKNMCPAKNCTEETFSKGNVRDCDKTMQFFSCCFLFVVVLRPPVDSPLIAILVIHY